MAQYSAPFSTPKWKRSSKAQKGKQASPIVTREVARTRLMRAHLKTHMKVPMITRTGAAWNQAAPPPTVARSGRTGLLAVSWAARPPPTRPPLPVPAPVAVADDFVGGVLMVELSPRGVAPRTPGDRVPTRPLRDKRPWAARAAAGPPKAFGTSEGAFAVLLVAKEVGTAGVVRAPLGGAEGAKGEGRAGERVRLGVDTGVLLLAASAGTPRRRSFDTSSGTSPLAAAPPSSCTAIRCGERTLKVRP